MRRLLLGAVAILAVSLGTVAASAQPASEGWGPRGGWGPGMMMGPGAMMGPGMMAWRGPGLCQQNASQMATWRIDRIEQIVKPTDQQKPALDNLKTALKSAADAASAGCPTEFPATMPKRLELMEKRMDAMLQSIKAIRPAFDAFYDVLNADQKARLDSAGPRRWGWHWR